MNVLYLSESGLFLTFICILQRPAVRHHTAFSGRKSRSSSGGGPHFHKIASCKTKLFVIKFHYIYLAEKRRAARDLKNAARRVIQPIPPNIVNTRMFIWFVVSRPVPSGWAGVFPVPSR